MRSNFLGGRSNGRLTGLLVIAAALVLPASAQAHPPDGGHGQLARVEPPPSAGWHGRAVREPHDHAGAPQRIWASYRPAGWSSGTVRLGSGYGVDGGSKRVRETQRMLHRLGYRPGSVDGLFGPRTGAAVRWFQRKHGLKSDGVVGAQTLAHLRYRSARASQDIRRELPSLAQPESPGTDATTTIAGAGERPLEAAEGEESTTADGQVERAKPRVIAESEPATSVRAGYAALLAALAIALVLLVRWVLVRRDGALLIRNHRGSAGAAAEATVVPSRRDRGAARRRLIARMRRGQARAGAVPVPVRANLWLEGKSRNPSIGDVRGFALTSVLVQHGEAQEALCLVHDLFRSEPVWIRQSDVASSGGARDAGRAGDEAPHAPPAHAPVAVPSTEGGPAPADAPAPEAAPATGKTGPGGPVAEKQVGMEEACAEGTVIYQHYDEFPAASGSSTAPTGRDRRGGSRAAAEATWRNSQWRKRHVAVITRRLVDITVAATVLMLLLPFIALLALAIKLDSPGPVFYGCRRVGLGGRDLLMRKFRKMRISVAGLPLTISGDERFTRLGHFLATTKLDELPQLWNVLTGSMTFVGPRPEDANFVSLRPGDFEEILRVKPGITGLSQLAFVKESEILDPHDPVADYVDRLLPQKAGIDRLYVARRSVLMDLRILAWTVIAIFCRVDVSVNRATGCLTRRSRLPGARPNALESDLEAVS